MATSTPHFFNIRVKSKKFNTTIIGMSELGSIYMRGVIFPRRPRSPIVLGAVGSLGCMRSLGLVTWAYVMPATWDKSSRLQRS